MTIQGRSTSYRLLRPDQVAEALNVSKRTVYRLCESGELISLKVRGGLRIPENALQKFIHRGIELHSIECGIYESVTADDKKRQTSLNRQP